jgi:hypothetical protein
MKRMVTFLMIFSVVLVFNGPLFAQDKSSGDLSTPEVVGDLLWVRPLGVLQIGLGATAFVLSLPVTLPLNKAEAAKEFLITYPVYYFIKRPLREM